MYRCRHYVVWFLIETRGQRVILSSENVEGELGGGVFGT